jgi:formylglycine-generating enzyme
MIVALWLALLLVASGASAQNAAPGSVFRDCQDCPELVVVPAGQFTMGSPDSEPGRDADEGPQHQVNVRAFAIGRTHVTRAQFQQFVGATGYSAGNDCTYWTGRQLPNGRADVRRDGSWRNPSYAQTDNDPVVCVNMADVEAYLRWVSQRAGHVYRLPSEAEWEYAARAETSTARWWGDGQNGACASANVTDEVFAEQFSYSLAARNARNMFLCRDGYARTSPVGSFRPNRFGLSDMLGNAWQWVADCYHGSYAGAPADGAAWMTGDCEARMLRGGSWLNPPRAVRSAFRFTAQPGERYDDVGFRVARTLTP